jgi:RNA polymerase sigma-70 factor (ECF subfamily)
MNTSDLGEGQRRGFPTTEWSMMTAASSSECWNGIALAYWRPIFYFIRARRYPLQDAEDLTQEFLFRVFSKELASKADPARGRFRSYLLRILTRFLSEQVGGRATRQRQFDRKQIAISQLLTEDDRRFEPTVDQDPETVFMQAWARSILAEAHLQTLMELEAEGKPHWLAIYHHATTDSPGQPRPTQEQLAARYELSRDQVRYAIEQVPKRIMSKLAKLISYREQPESIREEIEEILRLASS